MTTAGSGVGGGRTPACRSACDITIKGRAIHHVNRRQNAAGQWEIARPLRHSSWWFRYRGERACFKMPGHCWHPDGWIAWWCCLCSGETEGMPIQNCKYCKEAAE